MAEEDIFGEASIKDLSAAAAVGALLDDEEFGDGEPPSSFGIVSSGGDVSTALMMKAPPDDSDTLTKGIPTDPDVMAPGQSQWHLVGTWGLHADQVWNDYTGSGVLIGAMDDGFDYNHSEFGNYRTDLDYDVMDDDADAIHVVAGDRHGTAVLGTMIADDNGSGTVGVAFDAEGLGIRTGFGANTDLTDMLEGFQYAGTVGLDVMNNSWGFTAAFSDDNALNFGVTDIADITNQMADLAANGRGGLGTSIVFSAGNARTSGENVNYHNLQNSPYAIAVAAIDSDGTVSSFSNPGAALLISAGGTTVYTTDRSGAFGYSGGDYTNFSGTSASAPIISGMIGVLLEANPDLGWRDVQEILAYSAQHNDSGDAGWQYNGAGNWNGGGLHFSHDYGYGAADLFTAVRLAESWTVQQTSANMTTVTPISAAPALALPNMGTVTTTINVVQDIEIEHVIIHMDIDHTKAGDLVVTLISPDGTESVLVNRVNNGAFTTGSYGISGIDFEMTSTAHWGESSQGLWTLRIEDQAGTNTGILNDWSLSFLGKTPSADDVYIYTNDYGNFAGADLAARDTLVDSDGGTDTINLAAITTNTTLNMNAGTASTVAGNTLNIAGGTIIENAWLGDGDDTVTGNASANDIHGGRGDDTIIGSAGNDTLDGQSGTDTVSYLSVIADFTFNFIDAVTLEITNTLGSWTDTVLNFENFSFTDGSYTRAGLEAFVGVPPPGPIRLDFRWSGGRYLETSDVNGTSMLTAADMGYGAAVGDMVELTRSGSSLTIDYQDANAPNVLLAVGGSSSDVISIAGASGNLRSRIYGYGGNDVLTGGDGKDIFLGGVGNDTMEGGRGNDFLNGGTGTDTAVYSADSSGFVVYRVSSYYLTIEDKNDPLNGFGIDRIYNDVEQIQFNDMTLDLTSMVFTIGGEGWGSAAAITGTAGDDTLRGTGSDDEMHGDDGNDTLIGGSGDDAIYGDAGNDKLYGYGGNDTIYGGAGNDSLKSGAGNDTLIGGTGSDIIIGGTGTDTAVYGANSAGFVIYRVSSSYITIEDTNDPINGLGIDKIYNDVENIQFDDVTLDLTAMSFVFNDAGWGTSATITGTAGNDDLDGTNSNDEIHGGDGWDSIRGYHGNDLLYGDAGNDYLNGYGGNDLLVGGAGLDTLFGGAGNDQFGFTTLGDGIDKVSDITAGDTLNITDILSGFTLGVDDINDFVQVQDIGSAKTFMVNADGVGADSVAAFSATGTGLAGLTVQDMLNTGVLVVNQTLL